jgi:hypothetical protein
MRRERGKVAEASRDPVALRKRAWKRNVDFIIYSTLLRRATGLGLAQKLESSCCTIKIIGPRHVLVLVEMVDYTGETEIRYLS